MTTADVSAPTATPAAEGATTTVPETTAAATQSPSEAPTQAQENAKAASYKERKAKALAIFNAGSKPAEAAPAPTLEGAASTAVESADSESAEPTTAAPKTEAPDAKAETAHARALAALRKAEAENLRLKNESKAAADKLAADREADRQALVELQKRFESITKDPVAALKAAGMTADQFMRAVVDKKITPPAPEDELREQVQSKLSPLEQKLAEMEAKLRAKEEAEAAAQQEAQTRQVRERDLGTVKSIVTAEEFPVTAALGAFDVVLDACYRDKTNDVAGKAAEFEAHQIALLENLLNPKVLAALEKRSPKIRETVGALRGPVQSRQAAGSSGGPRVAARDVVSAPTTPVERPKTFAERRARAAAILNGKLS